MTQRLKRAHAIEIAKRHAKNSGKSYYTGPDFEPHEWVIQAILEAANNDYKMRDENGTIIQG